MLHVLIEGWISYPHSYSVVNVYQILALNKLSGIKLVLHELPPYNSSWIKYKNLTDILLTSEEQNELNSIEKYNEYSDKKYSFDLIYRISYPFNISKKITSSHYIPLLLFFTSEFQVIRDSHIDGIKSFRSFIDDVKSKKIIPITPSKWSANTLIKHNEVPFVVPHGVDTSKFYPTNSSLRDTLNIPTDAFVFLTVGAMTENKNIKGLIKSFYNIMISFPELPKIYLILKGIGNLYNCQTFINDACKILLNTGVIDKNKWKNVKKNIIFIDDLYSYSQLNELYNAVDCYISPYIAEGFNMPVLEAMSCGIPIVVSQKGSTDDFTLDTFAKYVKTTCVTNNISGDTFLIIDDISLQNEMISMITSNKEERNLMGKLARIHVVDNYTWDNIANQLFSIFKFIIPNFPTNIDPIYIQQSLRDNLFHR